MGKMVGFRMLQHDMFQKEMYSFLIFLFVKTRHIRVYFVFFCGLIAFYKKQGKQTPAGKAFTFFFSLTCILGITLILMRFQVVDVSRVQELGQQNQQP